jgi:FkbM family methyltransferase
MSEIKLTEFENPEIYLSTKPEKDVLFAKICIAKQRSSCFRTSPSLMNFFKGNTKRLQQMKDGFGLMGKLNLLLLAILQSVPNTVRSRIGRFDVFLKYAVNSLCKNIIVKIGDCIYAVRDLMGLEIVSYSFEPHMRKHFTICRGGVFLDVGAHVGKYSVAASKIVGSEGLVVAMEPSPENFRVLKQNIKLNDLKNVVPYNLAAWNEDCTLTFFAGDSSAAFSVEKCYDRIPMIVQAIPLDAIVSKLNCNRVDLVKIDVEGAEYEVLLGLEDILRNFSPKVIVEVWMKNMDRVVAFFNNLGYTVNLSEGSEFNIGSPNYTWYVDVLASPNLT